MDHRILLVPRRKNVRPELYRRRAIGPVSAPGASVADISRPENRNSTSFIRRILFSRTWDRKSCIRRVRPSLRLRSYSRSFLSLRFHPPLDRVFDIPSRRAVLHLGEGSQHRCRARDSPLPGYGRATSPRQPDGICPSTRSGSSRYRGCGSPQSDTGCDVRRQFIDVVSIEFVGIIHRHSSGFNCSPRGGSMVLLLFDTLKMPGIVC
jgi:hypothetical protein